MTTIFSKARFICLLLLLLVCLPASQGLSDPADLVQNGDFQTRDAARQPAGYQLAGDVEYRYLGDPAKDVAGWGVALQSGKDLNHDGQIAGSLSQTVAGIDPVAGRWFRFTFRGLPQDNFAVADHDMDMKVEFFGDGGKTSYDAKAEEIYSQIERDRQNFSVNGDQRVGGAAVWRTYQLDFYLPFPQVNQLRLSVNFGHGSARTDVSSEFFISDFSLTRIAGPAVDPLLQRQAATQPSSAPPSHGHLLPLGGRWYYDADPGQPQPPKTFDHTNADRLLYHDALWQAPFAGNMTAWLRAGDKDLGGNIVVADQLIADNVTVSFDDTSMIIHTKGLPNHPTAKFPEAGWGPQFNPNYIQEHQNVYYIPLDPKVNPRHIFTATDNSNHALPMGPIGIAVNGVVFFNPFDANSQDASSLMDRCCGHPAPDNTYHYHKYPICIYSPWADQGQDHSPIIGWAFDGFPIYGPYESPNKMAKDITGDNALNAFNLHFDKDRGWHYHVTPGKFPYIIGGYWGTEDPRDAMRGNRRGGPNGNGGPPNGGSPGGGPPNGGPPGRFPPDGGPPPFGP